MTEICERIKFFRERTGLSQVECHFRAFGKKGQKHWSRLETYQEPKASEIPQIARALTVRIEDLFSPWVNPELVARLERMKA